MKDKSNLELIERCRVRLYLHGFLTESENKKVKNRVLKWHDKNTTEKGLEEK